MLIWDDPTGKDYSITEISEEFKSLAEAGREQMMEKLADCDESIMEKFLEGDESTC